VGRGGGRCALRGSAQAHIFARFVDSNTMRVIMSFARASKYSDYEFSYLLMC
jgi:hypothetical protein